jgi:hypothetical protein
MSAVYTYVRLYGSMKIWDVAKTARPFFFFFSFFLRFLFENDKNNMQKNGFNTSDLHQVNRMTAGSEMHARNRKQASAC